MSFAARHDKIIAKRSNFSNSRFVIISGVFSFAMLLVVYGYMWVRLNYSSLAVFNRAIADAGMLLIGISFALGALCYFWDFVDTKIVYRKHIGLYGFGFVLTHSLLSVFGLPRFFPFPRYYVASDQIVSFIFSILSIVIFMVMALISNQYAIHELGGKLWRKVLRVGYLAYLFAIIHYGMKTYDYWFEWLTDEVFLPPMSLLVTIFAVWVFILRGLLWFDVRSKQ